MRLLSEAGAKNIKFVNLMRIKNKILAVLSVLLIFGPLCSAQSRDAQLTSLIKSYKKSSGFEVVDLHGPLMSLARIVIKANVQDREDREMLNALKGAKRLTVVDYEDSPEKVKAKFNAELERILKDEDLLMEAIDGKDKVRIYGVVSEDGSTIKDFIIHEQSGGALIRCSGKFNLDEIVRIINDSDD